MSLTRPARRCRDRTVEQIAPRLARRCARPPSPPAAGCSLRDDETAARPAAMPSASNSAASNACTEGRDVTTMRAARTTSAGEAAPRRPIRAAPRACVEHVVAVTAKPPATSAASKAPPMIPSRRSRRPDSACHGPSQGFSPNSTTPCVAHFFALLVGSARAPRPDAAPGALRPCRTENLSQHHTPEPPSAADAGSARVVRRASK